MSINAQPRRVNWGNNLSCLFSNHGVVDRCLRTTFDSFGCVVGRKDLNLGPTDYERTVISSFRYPYTALECFRRGFRKTAIVLYCSLHPSFCAHSRHRGVTEIQGTRLFHGADIVIYDCAHLWGIQKLEEVKESAVHQSRVR
jgi:hypothetical protein